MATGERLSPREGNLSAKGGRLAVTLLVVGVLAMAPRPSRAHKSGEFVVDLISIDNHLNESREFVDWHFFVKRLNKNDKVIDGSYTVLKDVVRPKVDTETYLQTKNKFVLVDLNVPLKELCVKPVEESFLGVHFEGNSTWTEDCVMTPGHMAIKRNEFLDMNEVAHKFYSRVFYGTFKLVMNIQNEDGQQVAKVSVVLSTVKKE